MELFINYKIFYLSNAKLFFLLDAVKLVKVADNKCVTDV